MKNILLIILFAYICPFSAVSILAQESSGDGETAAEAAVTGSATNVADSASGSIEGNPLVIAVRSGTISLNDALRLGLAKIREIASAGGDFDKLLSHQLNQSLWHSVHLDSLAWPLVSSLLKQSAL